MNWIQKLFKSKKANEPKNSVLNISTISGISLQDRYYKIKLQEIEDEKFFANIKAEALRQKNKPKGWLIDPSRARLMLVYTVYDEQSAKYINTNPLEMCLELIKELP